MLEWEDSGIILSVRGHGETGGVASVLTQNHGRAMGYVYGVNSSKRRGILEIGNKVALKWHAKAQGQLGVFECELESSFAADVMDDPLKLTSLQSACTLADKTMPEGEKHTSMYDATLALLQSFKTEVWAPAYIYWEIGLLRELGFGLDLSKCVSTGVTDNLLYVSPKSGCAVSEAAGELYKEKLLKMPAFLRNAAFNGDEDILDGLRLTGHFLMHRVFAEANQQLPEPRLRLEEKYAKKVFG